MKNSETKALHEAVTIAGLFKSEAGSVYVEASISLMCFLLMLFVTMEICSASYTYTVLGDAANEGAHYAMFNSSDQTGAVNTVKAYARTSLHDTSRINVSVTYPDGTTTPPARVVVNVSYPYIPYISMFAGSAPTMHAYAEARMLR